MPFDSFMTDRVTLIKRSGERAEDIPASVQRGKIFINNARVLIEEGDRLERVASNGLREAYEVIDPGFHETFHGIEAHYQIEVRKETTRPRVGPAHGVTVNISGANPRLNINSVDNSTNTAPSSTVFQDLRAAIEQNVAAPDREAILSSVTALEAARGSTSLLARYQDFMAAAANHITVVAPFSPALTKLLS
jgi:hypothetical protein